MNHARRDLCGGCPVMGIPTAMCAGRDFRVAGIDRAASLDQEVITRLHFNFPVLL